MISAGIHPGRRASQIKTKWQAEKDHQVSSTQHDFECLRRQQVHGTSCRGNSALCGYKPTNLTEHGYESWKPQSAADTQCILKGVVAPSLGVGSGEGRLEYSLYGLKPGDLRWDGTPPITQLKGGKAFKTLLPVDFAKTVSGSCSFWCPSCLESDCRGLDLGERCWSEDAIKTLWDSELGR